MCRLLAVSSPFCIAGTRAAAKAHSTVIPAPANRWGPGNSFPVLNHVLRHPPTASNTPNARRMEPALKCLSLYPPFTSTFLTSASSLIFNSTGEGGVPSSEGFTSFLSTLISSWIVRTLRHCHPKYPAHNVYTNRPPITMGCTNAADLPSNRPNCPSTAHASWSRRAGEKAAATATSELRGRKEAEGGASRLVSTEEDEEEEEEEEEDDDVGDGDQEEDIEEEDDEDDDADEDEEEEDDEGESIAGMKMSHPLEHPRASAEESERLHSYGEGAALPHTTHLLQQKQRPHDDEDDDDDDMDSDQAFMERDDFDSANELAMLTDDPVSMHHANAGPHHSNAGTGFDAAAPDSLASEDLLLEKDDMEAEAEVGPEAEGEADLEEEEDTEPDFLDFLKRPPEEDDGTPEEQMEFVRVLERFFAERKMEYKHPKFYQENLNCLKLWRAVVRLGGYEAVTNGKLWRQVGDTFKPPKTCTTVSWSFRIFYKKALLEYERYKFRGMYPGSGQGGVHHDGTADAQADAAQPSSSQPSFMPNLGRARRDAASRAMQGWHSQRLFGNGDVGDPIIKEKAPSSSSRRAKQLKMGLLRKKKGINFDRAAHGARNKGSRSLLDAGAQVKDENLEEVDDPSYFSAQKKRSMKQDHAKQAWKRSGCNSTNGDDIWVADEGPEADWVKVNVHKARDCFEVYALVPGLQREEVRIQCEPGGQLVIVGEPEERNNPWGITSFKKVISLPLPIDASETTAVVTVQGQLFVRVPFDLTHS
eukprot:c19425_g1_i2 orf=431-2707(-)